MTKYSFILLLLLVLACSENHVNPVKSNEKYISGADAGLILVVETKFELTSNTEVIFQQNKQEMLMILSDMFGVSIKKMQNMTMSQIVEIYGEEWQIKEMRNAAAGHYKEIRVLTDSSASGKNLINSIAEFAGKGYYIDMVFSLHASSDKYICFIDRSYHISELTDFLIKNNYYIRSLYQTCCFGSYFFDDWKQSGIYALNGSVSTNSINIFSPIYFLQEWIGKGLSFNSAVQKSYDNEIYKLKSYSSILPIELYFLTQENLKNSRMLTGGMDQYLHWNEFPELKKNNIVE